MEWPTINGNTGQKKELSIIFCYVCGYCFDLMLCKKNDFKFENIMERIHNLTIYNLPFYINSDYKKRRYIRPALIFCACRHSFAMLTNVAT